MHIIIIMIDSSPGKIVIFKFLSSSNERLTHKKYIGWMYLTVTFVSIFVI